MTIMSSIHAMSGRESDYSPAGHYGPYNAAFMANAPDGESASRRERNLEEYRREVVRREDGEFLSILIWQYFDR